MLKAFRFFERKEGFFVRLNAVLNKSAFLQMVT